MGHRLKHDAAGGAQVAAAAEAQFALGVAHEDEGIAHPFHIRGRGVVHVGHDRHGRDENGAGNGMLLTIGAHVLIVEAVFARNVRQPIGHSTVVAALAAPY